LAAHCSDIIITSDTKAERICQAMRSERLRGEWLISLSFGSIMTAELPGAPNDIAFILGRSSNLDHLELPRGHTPGHLTVAAMACGKTLRNLVLWLTMASIDGLSKVGKFVHLTFLCVYSFEGLFVSAKRTPVWSLPALTKLTWFANPDDDFVMEFLGRCSLPKLENVILVVGGAKPKHLVDFFKEHQTIYILAIDTNPTALARSLPHISARNVEFDPEHFDPSLLTNLSPSITKLRLMHGFPDRTTHLKRMLARVCEIDSGLKEIGICEGTGPSKAFTWDLCNMEFATRLGMWSYVEELKAFGPRLKAKGIDLVDGKGLRPSDY
jgi:hypothetical protein